MAYTQQIALALVLLALTGCERARLVQSCRDNAGPEPYGYARAFGALGDVIAAGTPEHQEWQQRVDACMEKVSVR